MAHMSVRTRFAPSPSGHLHVGNARTALFSAFLAARAGGVFILRIEDTDAERSHPALEEALLEDLRWLGLRWQEGPDVGGAHGPYRQSERGAHYEAQIDKLAQRELTYPCFCTPAELALARKSQLAAGQPPRYVGTCARLTTAQIEARLAQGLKPALRFRVPERGETAFDDLIRGPQCFAHQDIGDFVIRRADGSPAFFFSNAVDDALMNITHVLRGEDHLANTPRQLLVLRALGLPAPRYGHLPLVLGPGGAPLSKREGGGSLRELRAEGLLPEALVNYLARLGHSYTRDEPLTFAGLARDFDLARVGHAPAHFDRDQLEHWQRETLDVLPPARLWQWAVELQPEIERLVPAEQREAFISAVRGNSLRASDLGDWARILFGESPPADASVQAAFREAGPALFDAALSVLRGRPAGFHDFARRVGSATGASGRRLYRPLRLALTGREEGPEMERLWALLPPALIATRLQRAADYGRSTD